jgi:AraC-like DNA-binding protein
MSRQPRPAVTAQGPLSVIPAVNVLLIRDALAAENVSDYDLFRGTGISMQRMEEADCLLNYEQVVTLISNAVRLAREPGLGLRIGSQESPTDWGILGYAMLSCATVRDVLDVIMRFHRTAASMADPSFTVEGDLAFLGLVPRGSLRDALPFVIEEHFGAFCSALRMLTNTRVPNVQLSVSYPRPGYYRQYEAIFRCPVNFRDSRNQLAFRASFLEARVAQSNAFSARMAERICGEQMSRQVHEPDFVQQVRYLVLLNVNDFPDAEAVSERLQITSRTLRNRLRACGTSFQQLIDDVRRQLAISYLESSDLHVDEVAELLGFRDRSNFRRAFMKWTGRRPSDFRRQR